MKISNQAQEILEEIWTEEEEGNKTITPDHIGVPPDDEAIKELIDKGILILKDGKLVLTPKGREEARNAIRRHRLAERLLYDVLETGSQILEDRACRFEHLLYEGIDESICTLLGHPRFCPHGKPIPPGECCLRARETGERVVSALTDLKPGQKGKIAYLQAKNSKELQKLMAMGILPGTPIELRRRFPSYIFRVGYTEYAVDRETADQIYVRLER
ncbi:metal-dependent transcriptional regulator [Candidatus Poribacteria bacterium]|nr:metal-dependent transcriptional regulator [Candidatus Poribacteria bacterium]